MKSFHFATASLFFVAASIMINVLTETLWGIAVECVLMGFLFIADSLISAIKEGK